MPKIIQIKFEYSKFKNHILEMEYGDYLNFKNLILQSIQFNIELDSPDGSLTMFLKIHLLCALRRSH